MSAIDTWVAQFDARRPAAGRGLPWLAACAGARSSALPRGLADPPPRELAPHLARLHGAAVLRAPVAPADPAAIARALRGTAKDDGTGHWLVFVGGRHAPSCRPSAPARRARRSQPRRCPGRRTRWPIEAAFGSAEDGDSPAALNAAFAGDGALIPPRARRRGRDADPPGLHRRPGDATPTSAQPRHRRRRRAGDHRRALSRQRRGRDADHGVTRIEAGADAHITH
jgi:Fe-S cluster assembly protein SufD